MKFKIVDNDGKARFTTSYFDNDGVYRTVPVLYSHDGVARTNAKHYRLTCYIDVSVVEADPKEVDAYKEYVSITGREGD